MKAYAHLRSSRRHLLRQAAQLGLLTGLSATVAACAPYLQAPPSQPAREDAPVTEPLVTQRTNHSNVKSTVAFVKTTDRAYGVREALRLLGPVALAGKSIVFKPNFNSADPAPGSTHPAVLRTMLEELWAREAKAITIVDRSGMGNTQRVMEELGVFATAQALDAQTTVLDDLSRDDWEVVQPDGSHWRQGFPMARACLEADAVVQTCCLKTHRFGGHFTLSLKNSVGLVAKFRPGDSYNYMNELHGSEHQRRMIAEINTSYTPALIVMDGVEAFTDGGPASGKRVQSNVVLASADRIAIDAVGVALLRHFGTTAAVSEGAIFDQEQIARAVELGLGVTDPRAIELVTGDPASAAYAGKIRAILDQG